MPEISQRLGLWFLRFQATGSRDAGKIGKSEEGMLPNACSHGATTLPTFHSAKTTTGQFFPRWCSSVLLKASGALQVTGTRHGGNQRHHRLSGALSATRPLHRWQISGL